MRLTLNIDIIDQEGNYTDLSKEISFNYVRNAYDFQNAMIYNANIDIRLFPFFPYDGEFQKDVYPSLERKNTILYLTEQMKERFQNKAEMILYIYSKNKMENG